MCIDDDGGDSTSSGVFVRVRREKRKELIKGINN
jgi:hypothetical protein